MASLTALVLARLGTLTNVDILDGGVLKTPTKPWVSFSGGIQTGTEQRYGDSHKRIHWTYTAKVVNDTPEGCRLLADQACSLLNDPERIGLPADGLWSALDYASDLITDDSIEGNFQHSITTHFTARTEEQA